MIAKRFIHGFTGCFVTVLACLLAGGVQAEILFTDVSESAGVDYLYTDQSRHALGLNWIDYNNDDWPDMFLVNGSTSDDPHLFRNNGDGTFTNVDEYLPPLPNLEMMGSVFADYDRDGDKDIYIFTNVDPGPNEGNGGPPNLLLRNLWADNGNRVVPGQPLFEEVAAQAGVDDLMDVPGIDGPGFNAPTGAWLDYDRDGYIDLFVGHWAGAPDDPGKSRLYRNTPGGPLPFTDVTTAAGINSSTGAQPVGDTLAIMAGHLNDDMWPDIYEANIMLYDHDLLYENQAGTFVEVIDNSPGVGDDTDAAMGLAFGDVENDGDWDVYISNISGNAFYLNESAGGLLFQDNSVDSRGIRAANSWGANLFDADHDGDEDLFVATMSHLADFMYENDGSGNFTEIPMVAFSGLWTGRGSALADYDHDGDLDLGVVNADYNFQLFRNDSPASGHWLQIKLVGVTSNIDAIGAKVRVTTPGGRQFIRQITGGNSAHSQDSPVVHFGLDNETLAESIEISWPSGAVQNLDNVAADRFITLEEGNAGPSVSISSPTEESVFGESTLLTFSGRANNATGGDLTSALSWDSDKDGVIGSGGSFSTSALSVGTHTITAAVTDGGGTGSAEIKVTVTTTGGNTAPVVSISAPANGSAFEEGASVTFTGSASDTEDGNLTAGLSWSSSLDGAIPGGSGGSFGTPGLSVGTHTITAAVTDSGGLTGSAVLTVTINPAGGGNTVPVVSISAPADGSAWDEGTSVTFAGSAGDTEDGDVTSGLSWSSNLDGAIPGGSGGSFSTSGLSVGTHTVTAAVTDNGGLPGSAVVTVIINPTGGTSDTFTLTSRRAEDGIVVEAGESKEIGGQVNSSRISMLVGDSAKDKQYQAIVSFDTSTLPVGTAIISATLRLKRNSVIGTNPFETHGAALVDIQTGGFSGDAALQSGDFEASATATAVTTLSNAANDGDWSTGVLDAAGVGAINRAGLTQMRIYFTLDDNDDLERDIIRYFSGDDGDPDNHPQLVITTDSAGGGNTAPVVSISAPADGSAHDEGTSVTFTGSAGDTEDGDVTSGLSWSSNINGPIGSGGSFPISTLSAGTHTITASVTDSGGLTGSATRTVTINPVGGNELPVVSITAPANGAAFDAGTEVTFSGSASDTEDGDVTAGLSWSSSIDGSGPIGSGGSFPISTLSAGTHTITAAVIDSGGLTGSAVLTVTINPTGGTPGELTFTSRAAEDGIVVEAGESKEIGGQVNSSRISMLVGDSAKDKQYQAIVSFDTSTLPVGAAIISATLRLKRNSVIGTNPFETHGAALVDIQTGGFSGDAVLQSSDFEASATATAVTTLSNAANDGDWSTGVLDAAGVGAINRASLTQMRIYFTLDDNDDLGRDFIRYFSGDDADPGNHPQLVVTYQ